MKKVLLSIAALFTVATYASAQETGFGFGPKVGINLSNQTLLDGDYKTGLTAGVFADYRFSNLVRPVGRRTLLASGNQRRRRQSEDR